MQSWAEPTGRAKPERYRLFLDESGDHTLHDLENPHRRYLALLGVWFRQRDEYVDFVARLGEFKQDIFGPRADPPILHRKDIVNRRGPFGILIQPDIHARFNAGLLRVISEAQFRLACVTLDKLDYSSRYASPFHPYHFCLAALLDHFSAWLDSIGAVGDVVAESRGAANDQALADAYERLYGTGELIYDRERNRRVLTSRKPKVRDKQTDVPGLQLADLLAYPVKQRMLLQRGLISDPGDVFGAKLVRAVAGKFHRNDITGEAKGDGQVWLPK